MKNHTIIQDSTLSPGINKTVSPEGISEQVERIISSNEFEASEQVRTIFKYLIDETLAGRSDKIKGYTIAVDGLHRPPDFDAQTDTIVRVQVRQLRRALKEYYLGAGSSDPIRIDIPKGAYTPVFRHYSYTDINPDLPDKSEESQPDNISSKKGPTIAVLPFRLSKDDPQFQYFADGITTELNIGLMSYYPFQVVGRDFILRYKDSENPLSHVSEELDVQFVITGSLRKSADNIRLTCELVDVESMTSVWGETFNRNLSEDNFFTTIDEITRRIVAQVGDHYGVIARQLAKRTIGKASQDLGIFEAISLYHFYDENLSLDRLDPAIEALETACKYDPTNGLIPTLLARLYADKYVIWGLESDNILEKARALAMKALKLNPELQEVRMTMSLLHFWQYEHEAAIEEAQAVINLNPYAAHNVAFAGFIIGLSGQLVKGKQIIEDMQQLNPYQPGWMRIISLLFHIENEDYENSLYEALKIGVPDFPWDPLLRASMAAKCGKNKIASQAFHELSDSFPDVAENPHPVLKIWYHFDRWTEPILEGLEMARESG